jgi:hypothetical protein
MLRTEENHGKFFLDRQRFETGPSNINQDLVYGVWVKVKVKLSLFRPWRFQGTQASTFPDKWHIKVVRLSVYAPAAFTTQEIFLVLISVRG